MRLRRSLQPNLAEIVLEDRILMDGAPSVSPLVLATSGYLIPPIASSSFALTPFTAGLGSTGINGGLNLASSFYITGFGLSVMMIGDSSGFLGFHVMDSPSLGGGVRSGLTFSLNAELGINQAGGARIVSHNAFGQSTPLNPGSGFFYIGQSVGSNASGTTTMVEGQAESPPPRVPVSPVAPMGPLVPTTTARSRPSDINLEGAANPLSLAPASAAASPALSGTIQNLSSSTLAPSAFVPNLTGTIPLLRGTIAPLNPRQGP